MDGLDRTTKAIKMDNKNCVIDEAIECIKNNVELSSEVCQLVMRQILAGESSFEQSLEFLRCISLKGETVNEMLHFCKEFRKHYELLFNNERIVELVGTGGDKKDTFNISSAAAIIAASAGIPIAKYGNRASSSASGSADVFEALGVNVYVQPKNAYYLVKDVGICYINNNLYPSIMHSVAEIRRRLATVTIFNKLRWINPSGAKLEMLGVYDNALASHIAKTICSLGTEHAFVVHGLDGMDEVSVCAPTKVYEIFDGVMDEYIITPEDFGLRRWNERELYGGTPSDNARTIEAILSGKEVEAKLDAALINAAMVIKLYDPSLTYAKATEAAKVAIYSGNARKKLADLIIKSNN